LEASLGVEVLISRSRQSVCGPRQYFVWGPATTVALYELASSARGVSGMPEDCHGSVTFCIGDLKAGGGDGSGGPRVTPFGV
jgi:hypothetical protein